MKNKLSCILFASFLFTAGCKKLLEVTPQSSITEATYFTSEGDFEPYVTGIYTSMRTFANNITYGTERSEELVAASNSRFTTAWSQILTPATGAVNYNDWYKAIGNCNLLLQKIKDFTFSSADNKKRIIAETYALRAYFYFSLTRIIGDAPIMVDAVTNDQVKLLARSPAVDVMKQIQSDLDAAIAGFKSLSNFAPTLYPSYYRFAYGSTQALKADAKLWSAKVLGGGTADFNDAITAISEVELSGRTLNADFKSVTTIRAATNPEAILAAFFLRDETNGSSNYGLNALPFLTIVQGALNIDSLPYTNSSSNGQGAYQISPKSKALFTSSADKRIPFTWVTERQATGSKISWITKLPGTKYADDRISDNDIPVYRLADVFLMKAEAYAGLDNSTMAITYLNKIRTRAGTGAYAGATDKGSVEKEILDERGREFYFENKRWYDLVRFHTAGTINVYAYVPNLVGKTTPLYWPINTTVLANNNLIKQTTGY
jgi:starch-binding outer membrane protein, SusD/RagB family